jgi:hypothetical protein
VIVKKEVTIEDDNDEIDPDTPMGNAEQMKRNSATKAWGKSA